MSDASANLKLGQVLFRFRSFTPIPVLIGLSVLLWRSRPSVAHASVGWFVGGALVAAAGQALRFYTLSWVTDGTSGQDDELEAKRLNTRGPYAHVRNPLYLGNLLICVGLLVAAKDAWVALLGLLFFFGEYFFIIRAEEDFLRRQFADAYERYFSHVRRWLPRLTPAFAGRLREGSLDWRRGLKKEHNPFAAWSLGLIALRVWELRVRGESWSTLWPELAAAAVIVAAFVGIKGWKRGYWGSVRGQSPHQSQ